MSKIQDLKGTHNTACRTHSLFKLFLMSKIQDLKGTHNCTGIQSIAAWLFLMSKIQDLKGTHNRIKSIFSSLNVVSDVKDTRFERNSQHPITPEYIPSGCF